MKCYNSACHFVRTWAFSHSRGSRPAQPGHGVGKAVLLCSLSFLSDTLSNMQIHRQRSRYKSQGHFTKGPRAKCRDHEIVRAQKKVSKGRPKTTSKNHVVWSQTLKCSVKSYVTKSSTKCYFNESLFMWDLHTRQNILNLWL